MYGQNLKKKEMIKMKNKIPKVVHYIWFGNGEKSDLIKNKVLN